MASVVYETLAGAAFERLLASLVDIKFQTPWEPGAHSRVFTDSAGEIYKFFYPSRKKRFSLRRFRLDAKRYGHNATKFAARGIPAARITHCYYNPQKKWHIVRYPRLDGEKLRFLTMTPALISKVLQLMCVLHQKGVYFRGCHLDNLILQADGTLALIDFVDVRFQPWALSPFARARNLYHLMTNRIDWAVFANFGEEALIEAYLAEAKLSCWQRVLFTRFLRHKLEHAKRR